MLVRPAEHQLWWMLSASCSCSERNMEDASVTAEPNCGQSRLLFFVAVNHLSFRELGGTWWTK